MVITIEPIVNIGMRYSKVDLNGWTVRTMDGNYQLNMSIQLRLQKMGQSF